MPGIVGRASVKRFLGIAKLTINGKQKCRAPGSERWILCYNIFLHFFVASHRLPCRIVRKVFLSHSISPQLLTVFSLKKKTSASDNFQSSFQMFSIQRDCKQNQNSRIRPNRVTGSLEIVSQKLFLVFAVLVRIPDLVFSVFFVFFVHLVSPRCDFPGNLQLHLLAPYGLRQLSEPRLVDPLKECTVTFEPHVDGNIAIVRCHLEREHDTCISVTNKMQTNRNSLWWGHSYLSSQKN